MITAFGGPASWLAETPPPAQGPEFGGSSPIGLVVILLLAVALMFLIKSMNKHLRKVPRTFDSAGQTRADEKQPDQERPAEAAAAGAGDADTADATNGAGTSSGPGAANGAGTGNGDQGRSRDAN